MASCRNRRDLLRQDGCSERQGQKMPQWGGHVIWWHITYRNIDGLDYLILVEADFLVNMYEDKADADTIRTAYDNIFATESGKMLCRQLFSLEY